MTSSLRQQLVLAAIAGVVYFVNLGGTHLWDVDEAIFTQAAKEMYQRGDAVTPYFNGEVFPDKPAMMYWLMIGAFEMFGTSEFAARFFSAVFGIGSVLLTYRLGRLVFSPAVAFWSALILATSLNYCIIARAATPDSFLVFFSTLAMLLFVAGTAKARPQSGEPNERNTPWAGQTRFEPSWGSWLLVYAAMAGGVLTKGPVGVVLPTATIGLFLLIMRAVPLPAAEPGWRAGLTHAARWCGVLLAPRHVLRTIWSMRPLSAVAMMLVVAGPWYVWVGIETGGEWPAGFFGVHNFGRFINAMDNHRGPIFYYVIAIAAGFFPWSVLAWPTVVEMRKLVREGHPWRPGYVLVGSWVAVWVGFFSLAGTKLPSYIVPAYPAPGAGDGLPGGPLDSRTGHAAAAVDASGLGLRGTDRRGADRGPADRGASVAGRPMVLGGHRPGSADGGPGRLGVQRARPIATGRGNARDIGCDAAGGRLGLCGRVRRSLPGKPGVCRANCRRHPRR